MAATTSIRVFHGNGATIINTLSEGQEIRYKRADNDTVDTLNPVQVPTNSATAYSWRKYFKLKVDTAPSGKISNLRWFSDGTAWGTGIRHFVYTIGSYATQPGTNDETAEANSAQSNSTQFTSASPLTVRAGTVLTATTGLGTQQYVGGQVGVISEAGPGTTSPRTHTYRKLIATHV
jgi:hypothetical protein